FRHRTRLAVIAPNSAQVPAENVAEPTRNTVVVLAMLIRFLGSVIVLFSVVTVLWTPLYPSEPSLGTVALVVLIPALRAVTVDVVSLKLTLPSTSQSPAVRLILVTLAAVAVVRLTALPLATRLETNSPILPAAALSFVVVPMMPPVTVKLAAPDALSDEILKVLAALLDSTTSLVAVPGP